MPQYEQRHPLEKAHIYGHCTDCYDAVCYPAKCWPPHSDGPETACQKPALLTLQTAAVTSE